MKRRVISFHRKVMCTAIDFSCVVPRTNTAVTVLWEVFSTFSKNGRRMAKIKVFEVQKGAKYCDQKYIEYVDFCNSAVDNPGQATS